MEIAVFVEGLGRVFGALVVFLKHRHTLHQYFAGIGNFKFDARRGPAHRGEVDLAIALQAYISTGFGLAVKLFKVDADGTEETEEIGADGSTRGVRHAYARQAQCVLERAIDENIPKRVGHADRKSTRLNSSHVRISYAVFC